jgi:hypothetical protein
MAELRMLMLVEGPNDEHVLYNLCSKNQFLPLFPVEAEGSVSELLKDLPLRLKAGDVDRLGIIVDTDKNISSRWSQLKSILERAGYQAVPSQAVSDGSIIDPPDTLHPRVGIWIMPDNTRLGALEDFLFDLVPPGNALWQRAATAVDDIPAEERLFKVQHRNKAHIHTWLAWQEEPAIPLGKAIGRGILQPTNPLVVLFLAWLKRLYG